MKVRCLTKPVATQNKQIATFTIDYRLLVLFSNQIEMIKMYDSKNSDVLHILLLFVCKSAYKLFDVKWTQCKRMRKLGFHNQLCRHVTLVTADFQTVTVYPSKLL